MVRIVELNDKALLRIYDTRECGGSDHEQAPAGSTCYVVSDIRGNWLRHEILQ